MSRTVTVRRWSTRPDSARAVDLRPGSAGRHEVYLDGQHLGSILSYRGSLDRTVERVRLPGTPRTLWAARRPEVDARSLHNLTSRADAIRHLMELADIS